MSVYGRIKALTPLTVVSGDGTERLADTTILQIQEQYRKEGYVQKAKIYSQIEKALLGVDLNKRITEVHKLQGNRWLVELVMMSIKKGE